MGRGGRIRGVVCFVEHGEGPKKIWPISAYASHAVKGRMKASAVSRQIVSRSGLQLAQWTG
jgi:hypothetical protein